MIDFIVAGAIVVLILAMPVVAVLALPRSLAPRPMKDLVRILRTPTRPWRQPQADDPWKDADDGLITAGHLEQHLPAELPFHGRILTRNVINPWHLLLPERAWNLDAPKPQRYFVHYQCEHFFDCADHHPRFEVGVLTDAQRVIVKPLFQPNEALDGCMDFDRIPPAQLPDVIRAQMRALYWHLENHVKHEATEGCAIRPAPDRAA